MTYPIGSRVRVTDARTRIGGPAAGQPGTYVGATATVSAHFGDGTHGLDFDDQSLSSRGSWTTPALNPVEEEQREYVVGLPVCVIVHPSGRIDITVDLSEVDDIGEHSEYGDTETVRDIATVSAACARIGNYATTIIHPAAPNA